MKECEAAMLAGSRGLGVMQVLIDENLHDSQS